MLIIYIEGDYLNGWLIGFDNEANPLLGDKSEARQYTVESAKRIKHILNGEYHTKFDICADD